MTSFAPSVLDALLHPDDTAAGLARWTPQAVLVEALDELRPELLGVEGQIDAVVAVERHIAMLQARSAELLAALDAGDDSVDGFTRDSVAAALRVPPASMRTRMTAASDLAVRLPAALALLRAGGISQRHAFDLADATRSLTPAAAAVVGRAVEQTPAQFRASVHRAVLRVCDAASTERAHTRAVSERRVVITPASDGMAELWALLPAEGAATVKTALDAMAYAPIHGKGGDSRTADQRRADALVDLAITALDADDGAAANNRDTGGGPVRGGARLARAHGQRPAIQVTVAASTLMGLDDQPAELDGYGPITAGMARRIATDPTATWRRLLTDDHGHVLSIGRRTYRPPADMAATVIARDQHCTFPGCRKKAQHSDLDHVSAYRPGDLTTTANLMCLCRRHHRLKHTGRWKITRDDRTGVTTWTDHHGRTYPSRPPDRPTTTTATLTTAAKPTIASTTTAIEKAPPPTDPDPPPF